MNAAELVAALHDGRRVYGTLLVSDSPFWPTLVGSLGLDYVFIDTEHIPIDRRGLSWMCRTYAALHLPPIVRIPSPDPYQACMVLDGGAAGVVAPYVETAEEVRRLVGAVKYRPLKGRSLQRAIQGEGFPEGVTEAYVTSNNAANALIVNIESTPAIENLDEILAVPGLDAVLVGPHDLSVSLGMPEQYEHPRLLEAIDRIITRARAAGVGAGVHAIFPDGWLDVEVRWMRLGANLILHGADAIAFQKTIRREIAQLRQAISDHPAESGEGSVNI